MGSEMCIRDRDLVGDAVVVAVDRDGDEVGALLLQDCVAAGQHPYSPHGNRRNGVADHVVNQHFEGGNKTIAQFFFGNTAAKKIIHQHLKHHDFDFGWPISAIRDRGAVAQGRGGSG